MVTKVLTLNHWPGAREAASGERPETLQINVSAAEQRHARRPRDQEAAREQVCDDQRRQGSEQKIQRNHKSQGLMRRLNILEPQADHGHEQDRQQKPGETMWTQPPPLYSFVHCQHRTEGGSAPGVKAVCLKSEIVGGNHKGLATVCQVFVLAWLS